MDKHKCFAEKWPILEEIITKVVEGVHLDIINMPTPAEFMTGYTIVFDAFRCTECSEEYYEMYQSTLEDYIFSMVLPELEEKYGEILLKELLQQWNMYKTVHKRIYKMFQHLDEYHIQIACLPSLLEITHLVFYHTVYEKMNDQVRDALLSEIERERNGEEIDHALMKNVVEIYVETADNSMRYYQKDFESAMLAETAEFYSRKASEWLRMHSPDYSPYDAYMQKVQKSLKEEETRVTNYLDYRSLGKLLKVVDHELLKVHERKLEEMSKMHEIFEKEWPILEVIVNKVIEGVHLDKNIVTAAEYMNGYTIVFQACRCLRCAKQYHIKYEKTLRDRVFSMVFPVLKEKNGESFLKELLQQWNKYKTLHKWLYKMFHRLDKSFTKLNWRPSLLELSHLIFHDTVYRKMNHQVVDILISEINRERNGEEIDQAFVKNVVQIYVEMADHGKHSMPYYVVDFELAMLKDTAQFYSRKALDWLIMSSSAASPYDAYMEKVEGSMEEEKRRVTNYLVESTLGKLLKVVNHQLLKVYERKLEEMKRQNLMTMGDDELYKILA